MIRKLLMVGAAAAIPLGAVAFASAPASAAKAPPPPSPTLNCSAAGTVSFAPPGISFYGTASPSKTSTTTTSGLTFAGSGCGSGGSEPANTILAKSTLKCNKKIAGEDANGNTVPSCVSGDRVYDQASGFASTGTATLQKALKKLTLTVNGITFAAKTTSTSIASCSGGEFGFALSGTVKAKPFTYSTFALTACLGSDTGPGTTGSFGADIVTALNGPSPAVTIATTQVDAVHSTLTIGGGTS
jgi:hypothetical protein